MHLKWISIFFTSVSLIAFALSFILPYDLMSDYDTQGICMNIFMFSGFVGFILSIISKAKHQILLLLFSLVPILLMGALLLLAYYITGW